jgi:hypothetical protein
MTPLLLLAAATFVGNDACRPCHQEITRSYQATAMARSTMPVAGDIVPPGRFRHSASGLDYSVEKNGSVSIRGPKGSVREQFDYVIGSGAAGFSYLIFRDRFLYQAPITWYSQQRRWDAAPGYQNDTTMAWDRPVDPSCLLCHASQLRHISGTFNRYAEKPFAQNGIGCERCHGPGSEHAQGKARMVVPTNLSAEQRDDVCRQCHLMGAARIEREGRTFAQYRAGDRLGDFAAYFVLDDPNGAELRTTSHVENFTASMCKQASGEKMWCGTCHDVHETPRDPEAWFRDKCLQCHSVKTRAAVACPRTPNCIGCHMPKSRAVDAGHGAFTDHRIARRPATRAAQKGDVWRLRPFSATDVSDLELAKAYLQLYQRTRDERQRNEATRIVMQMQRR